MRRRLVMHIRLAAVPLKSTLNARDGQGGARLIDLLSVDNMRFLLSPPPPAQTYTDERKRRQTRHVDTTHVTALENTTTLSLSLLVAAAALMMYGDAKVGTRRRRRHNVLTALNTIFDPRGDLVRVRKPRRPA